MERLGISWKNDSFHPSDAIDPLIDGEVFHLESSCLRNVNRSSAAKEKSEKRYSTGSAAILSPPVSQKKTHDTCLSSRQIKAKNREHDRSDLFIE